MMIEDGSFPPAPAAAGIPGRRFVATGAGPVAYLEAGSGPDVVLIHGTLVTADDLALALFETLSRRFHVVAFDRPGHGGTAPVSHDQGSPWVQAAMLADACNALHLHRPVVVGHSFGGAVALSIGMIEPDSIAGVVALAPICFPEPRLEQVLFGPRAVPVAGPVLAHTLGAALDVLTIPVLRHAMFLPQAMPAAYAAAFPFAWASRPDQTVADARDALAALAGLTRSAWSYAACRAGVVVLGGTRDLVVNNACQGRLAAGLIPGASFTWVEGAGHMLHHFHQERIEKALDLLGAAGPAS